MLSTQRLVILHTNDVHSFFEQMPKVATVIKQIRQKYSPEQVLTIDCGDHLDRMRVETEGTAGIANMAIMNETGYEFAVLGNNEGLTFTPAMLARLYTDHANFTVIGSNMFDAKHSAVPPWMVPYKVIQKGQLRIGMIGVTIDFTSFYKLLGWDVRDPISITERLVQQLRDQVDLIIVMSHLGLANDQKLAEKINGIDFIFGGHTHHVLTEPLRIGNTYICGAGKFGHYVGELQVQYDWQKKEVQRVTGRVIDVQTYDSDPVIEAMTAEYKDQAEQRMNEVVATLASPLSIDWQHESPLGNLLAAGIKKWTGAQFAIVNAGQIIHSLQAGAVTAMDLLQICPSPINPCTMRLRGQHIRHLLEEALLPHFCRLPIRGFGFRGQVLGTLCVDGLDIVYDPAAKSYEKIVSITVDGEPLQVDQDYVVGTIDMFTFGIGYTSFTAGKDVRFFLPEFIRDILQKQLRDPQQIELCHADRWHSR